VPQIRPAMGAIRPYPKEVFYLGLVDLYRGGATSRCVSWEGAPTLKLYGYGGKFVLKKGGKSFSREHRRNRTLRGAVRGMFGPGGGGESPPSLPGKGLTEKGTFVKIEVKVLDKLRLTGD